MSPADDLQRAARETADRLRARGIRLEGAESPDDLVNLLDGLEQFEDAVTSRGGDLMVDEGSAGHAPVPDDPHFALPDRKPREPVAEFLERLARATDRVRHHRPID